MESTLGRLEQVALREVWGSEAGHFTPWLARAENLSALGQELGIELDLESSETAVGEFRADLLCREVNRGHYVLIENQIEQTDHTHLGQLLTYAAGLTAVTIVWVARTIREEHRAALDWLNEVTSEDIEFYGIEVELWRIGNSLPAPKFNVVSRPNEWTKRLVSERGSASQDDPAFLEYWEKFKEHLKVAQSPLKPQKAHGQSWFDFSTMGRGIKLEAVGRKRDHVIRLELVISEDRDKSRINELRKIYEESCPGAVEGLEWYPGENLRQSKAFVKLIGADPFNEDDRSRQYEWLRRQAELMDAVFRPLVDRI